MGLPLRLIQRYSTQAQVSWYCQRNYMRKYIQKYSVGVVKNNNIKFAIVQTLNSTLVFSLNSKITN